MFDDDDPNGTWTTHLFRRGDNDDRLNRGDKTAIVIEDVSRERAMKLSRIIGDIDTRSGTLRARILEALGEDEYLNWAT